MNNNHLSIENSESNFMLDENEKAKCQLIAILKERRAILFASAGCSKIAGYPLWNEFLDEMRHYD
ncbi:MAG: hypothetical protein ACLP9S_06925 [Syntrophales bacterium]